MVLADAGRGDYVLCQITSRPYGDPNALPLDAASFASGSLPVASYVRAGRLFTASADLISKEAGQLTPDALARVVEAIVTLLRGNTSGDAV